jgi:hypothetical protein
MAKISKTQKKRRASRASGGAKKKVLSRQQREQAHAMSGYLVVWRHGMDDVPVGLYDSFLAAMSVAKNMSHRAGYAAAKKLDIDCSTPVCFAVVGFDKGKPVEMFIADRNDDA